MRLLARHFLQFASSEARKSISRLSMWLVVAASRGLLDIPHHPQSAIRRTTNTHLSHCWTNRLSAKSAWLFQGQFILLAVFLRQVAPITGLMPLDGCQNVILGKLSTLGRKYGDVFYS